jgi:surface protein
MISTTLSEFNPRQVEGTDIENEISITIEGTNLQILYKFFKENPSQVFINGNEATIQNYVIQNPNNLQTNNEVIIRWNREIYNCSCMFYGLANIISVNLTNFKLSNVINTEKMFYGCQKLKTIIFSHGMTKVENMKYMFYNCNKLQSLDLSSFNTAKVNNMDDIFNGCSELKSLDISNFNLNGLANSKTLTFLKSLNNLNKLEDLKARNLIISHITDISNIFKNNKNLISIDYHLLMLLQLLLWHKYFIIVAIYYH